MTITANLRPRDASGGASKCDGEKKTAMLLYEYDRTSISTSTVVEATEMEFIKVARIYGSHQISMGTTVDGFLTLTACGSQEELKASESFDRTNCAYDRRSRPTRMRRGFSSHSVLEVYLRSNIQSSGR